MEVQVLSAAFRTVLVSGPFVIFGPVGCGRRPGATAIEWATEGPARLKPRGVFMADKKDQIKLGVAVAIFLIAGFCVYWFNFRDPPQEAPPAAIPGQSDSDVNPTTPPKDPGGGPRRVMPSGQS
jgi:hypothetical protein